MRAFKLLGIAALAAIAVGALAGATPAFAEETESVFCSSVQESGECPAESIYGPETKITAEAKNLKVTGLLMGLFPVTVSCEASKIEGETTEAINFDLEGEFSGFTAEKCTEKSGGTTCEATSLSRPYDVAALSDGATQGNGHLIVHEGSGAGVPGMQVICSKLGLKCNYRVNEKYEYEPLLPETPLARLSLSGGNPAVATASEVPLSVATPEGGNCLGTTQMKMSGEFTISSPSPLYQQKAKTVHVELNPRPLQFKKVPEKLPLKIENKGTAEIEDILHAVVQGTGKFNPTDPNKCEGNPIKSTKTCTVMIECAKAGVGSFSVDWRVIPPDGTRGDFIVALKC